MKRMTFTADSVAAIIAGSKTQTRRIINPAPPKDINELHGGDLRKRAPYECHETGNVIGVGFEDDDGVFYKCRHTVGDIVGVAESVLPCVGLGKSARIKDASYVCYRDGSQRFRSGEYFKWTLPDAPKWPGGKWISPRFLPSWAVRVVIEITGVRCERVQDISSFDAEAEISPWLFPDVRQGGETQYQGCFRVAWERINGVGAWERNPWVWVYEFRKHESSVA